MNQIKVDNYLLWFDGSITVDPEDLIDYTIKLGVKNKLDKLYVSSINKDVLTYNSVSDNLISVKKDCILNKPIWNIPEYYLNLDINEVLYNLSNKIEHDNLYEERLKRLSYEIYLFDLNGLNDILRVIIYIIDEMKNNNIVWGVGRGSSCSSYLLYLLGLHEIDVIKYEIDISDFLKV